MPMRLCAVLATFATLALCPAQAADDDDRIFPLTPTVEASRNVPGAFDYYTLVLSWSPTHCLGAERGRDDSQCARPDGARYGFVLHGLWPQYEEGYPARCRTRFRPYVPEDTIGKMLDVMPNRGLIIHEYREHGTCSGLRPEGYYALARRLFDGITIPGRYRNPLEAQYLSPREVLADFLRANPGLGPSMITVGCDGAGDRLRDVRICMTKEGRPRACGSNEQRGTRCRTSNVRVPPVRSTKWDYDKNALPKLKRQTPATGGRAFEALSPRP